MIARTAGDARITQFCDQQSLCRNGNCLVQFASDCCVASDPCFEIENCLPLRSQRSLHQRKANWGWISSTEASLSKDISLLSFTTIVRIGFWRQTSKICAIIVINGNHMMQGSLTAALFGILRIPPFVNHKGKDVNSDRTADQWDEWSILGHAQINKGKMKGDDPEFDTVQTPKRFDRSLAIQEKIRKTFNDSIPNNAGHKFVRSLHHQRSLRSYGNQA